MSGRAVARLRLRGTRRFSITPNSAAPLRGWRRLVLLALVAAGALWAVVPHLSAQRTSPLIVVETTQGTFAFETYPGEAPRSVAHIVALAKQGFYDGQRVHRALPGFLVQFGDPQSRDVEKRTSWGRGDAASSGTPVGLAEISPRRKNVALAVGLAHTGEPAKADSQLYILLAAKPDLDGHYAVIGRVVQGEDIPARLQVGDQIRRVYVTE